MASQPWIFTQLGGDKKTIRLEGYAAPFGRPRKGAVVTESFSQKIQTVHYPGKNSVPTRHILGSKWEDMEMRGRWMSKFMGDRAYLLTANEMADEWIRFINEGERCLITWGNIISYTGVVEKIELARESEHEIAWKLRILVDQRPELIERQFGNPNASISGLTQQLDGSIRDFLSRSSITFQKTIPDWEPTLFDAIDGLISVINSYANVYLQIANGIDDFTKAATSSLFRLQSSARAIRTAVSVLSDTLESTRTDLILFSRVAEADVNWIAARSDMLLAKNDILNFLAETDRQIDIALRGRIATTYTARGGDTWEGIASLVFEDPTRSVDIRRANNIKFGELPQEGKVYSIPT